MLEDVNIGVCLVLQMARGVKAGGLESTWRILMQRMAGRYHLTGRGGIVGGKNAIFARAKNFVYFCEYKESIKTLYT